MKLQVIQIPASEMDNFSYIIYCPVTLKAAGVDPSMYPERMLAKLTEHGLTLDLLINTHGHSDHITGNEQILKETGARWAGHPSELPKVDLPLEEGTLLPLGVGSIQILHTPGHTPGGIVLDLQGGLITGDTLFVSRCGRADFPSSDPAQLYQSLQRLKAYPDETQIFPGHDYGPTPTSTIAWEKANNDYLKCPDLESFIRLRMG